jgi:hypothetical protein
MTAAAGTVMVLSALGSGASATPDASVTLCHATASTTNPYIVITVNADSIQTQIFGNNGHATHVGPIFDPNGGKNQPTWGDIIPPFTYVQAGSNQEIQYAGLNWPAGEPILDNGCQLVSQQTTPPPSTPVSTPVSTPESTPASTPETTPPTTVVTSPTNSVSGSESQSTSSTAVVVATSTGVGPIPGGVSAGLHTPVSGAGLKAWGTVLMLLGGTAGLLAGLWPSRRRARAH